MFGGEFFDPVTKVQCWMAPTAGTQGVVMCCAGDILEVRSIVRHCKWRPELSVASAATAASRVAGLDAIG